MELKVWVEGIQRVVCGITEQTTVQEVVIALAQATGRTGRYTLVEKWRENEKLLPPSEHPIKVLEKWGEYASDVQFLLKRTGASTTSSDIESTKGPERNVYRQSLPPLAKNREKNELLQALKRKEPKRKSLTITGGGSTTENNGDDGKDKRNQNSNGNNNRIAEEITTRYDRSASGSVPANVRKAAERFSANVKKEESGSSSSRGKGKDKSKSKTKSDKKTKDEPRLPKTPLIPPHMQNQKGGVGSATQALFPSESKTEVAAKSPTRKNPDSQIKNLNVKSGKVPLMPPSHKVLRSRNSSSTEQQPSQSSQPLPTTNHSRNLSSGSATPTQFSLPNENKLANYAHRYGNSLPRSKKKSWSEANSASVDDKRLSRDVTKKTALMPPSHRQRAMTPNPQIHREAFRTTSTDGFSSVPSTPVPTSRKSSSEQIKAVDNFSKLVREQQRHIEEQKDTANALDREIKSLLEKMQQRDQEMDGELAQLEERNRMLELQYEREYGVTDELSAEETKVNSARREMDNIQGEIDRSSADLNAYKRKTDDLSKAISEEVQLQKAKQQRQTEMNRNLAMRSKKDIDQVNKTLSSLEDEIKRIEKEIAIRDEDITEKYASLDTLNRELRQVNLQQFIRKTGSKVTVLPPEAESSGRKDSHSPGNLYGSNSALNISGSRSPLPPPPTQNENSEGVWV